MKFIGSSKKVNAGNNGALIHDESCYFMGAFAKFHLPLRWLREYLDRESGNGKARESFWDDPNGGSTTDLGRNSMG